MRHHLLVLFIFLSAITYVKAQSQVDSASVPLVVRKGFNSEHAEFSKKNEWYVVKHPHDEAEYIAFFNEGAGWTGRVFVDAHGNLSDLQARHIDSVPKVVQAKFTKQHYGAKIVQWSDEYYSRPYKYTVSFYNNMYEYIVTYDSLATRINTMILLPYDSLPVPSKVYLKARFGNFLAKESWPLRSNIDSANVKTYQVGIRKDKLNIYKIVFNSGGEFISSDIKKLKEVE